MKKKSGVHTNMILYILTLLFIAYIICRLFIVSLSKEVGGVNIKDYIAFRNTRTDILVSRRGTIYSKNGLEVLAKDVNSYTLVAYLDESRSENTSKISHVDDVEGTAKALSEVLNADYDYIYGQLSKDSYQVEFGKYGRNLSRLKKDEIESLGLNGLGFITNVKRYYPNGDFLSYTLGYGLLNEDTKQIDGYMGLERFYNDDLTGVNGYMEYEKDYHGFKLPDSKVNTVNAINGYDIYLTVDYQIQFYLDKFTQEAVELYGGEEVVASVMDAKTGAILAQTSYPSFDPNTRDISSYINPFVEVAFEPGSIMKTFTYMANMENGTYDESTTFKTGSIQVADATIKDWNKIGFGEINYRQGFIYSSNLGVINMVQKDIDKNILYDYLTKLGFGSKTGITLPNETSGKVSFKYATEVAAASFGQGITVTPIQVLQATTAVSNDGVLLKPYIVEKIVDPNTDEVIFEGSKTVIDTVASKETAREIRSLMYDVVNSDDTYATGKSYRLDEVELIGKTGTAQIAGPNGKYMTGTYIKSFLGMFPYENPEVVILVSVKGNEASANSLKHIVTNVSKATSVYLDMKEAPVEDKIVSQIGFYINKETNKVVSELNESNVKYVVYGQGERIINQYPVNSTTDDTVYLFTNNSEYTVDFMNMSKREVTNICSIAKMNCIVNGRGIVTSYSYDTENLSTIINLEEKKVTTNNG